MPRLEKLIFVSIVICLVNLFFAGCTFFNPPGSNFPASLIIEDTEITDRLGAKAKIYISTNKMPGGGVAAIQVNVGNFSWDPKMVKVLEINGLNGFTVLAQSFDNDQGTGGFAAVNPNSGVADGNILEIIVKRIVPSDIISSGLEIVKDQTVLGDTNNNPINNFTLVNGEIRLES